jgi:branched-chain amino acid transport system permease protein
MSLGLQLVVGFCKLFDLGYAGFVCLGAYCTGVLMTRFHWNYAPAAIASIVLSSVGGIVLGFPTLRLRGDYFAIVTFGFAELVVLTMRNWANLTGGPFGLGGIPDPVLLGVEISRYPPVGYYYLLLALSSIVLLGVWCLRRTMLGAQMIAVGDDERLCAISGIDIVSIKVSAFAISAGIGGLVGSFWAIYFKFLSYLDFTLILSVQVICIVILAGGRELKGLLLAAAVLAPTAELLRTWLRAAGLPDSARIIVFGIVLILLTLWRSRKAPADPDSLRFYPSRQEVDGGSEWDTTAKQTCGVEKSSDEDAQHLETARPLFVGPMMSDWPSETILEIRDLSVAFGGISAIERINLSISRRQVVAVVGANGSGKTSLLNAICGLVPSSGNVKLIGCDITKEPAWVRARRGIARTLQMPRDFAGLNDVENLALADWTASQEPRSRLFSRLRCVCRAALKGVLQKGTPSSHQQVRAAMTIQTERAFAQRGSVVLLDEPLAGQSSSWRTHIRAHIEHHKLNGGAVIVVEHNLESVLPSVDRILMLDKGKTMFLGSKEEFRDFTLARDQ